MQMNFTSCGKANSVSLHLLVTSFYSTNTQTPDKTKRSDYVLLLKMHLHGVILMYSLPSWGNEVTADKINFYLI